MGKFMRLAVLVKIYNSVYLYLNLKYQMKRESILKAEVILPYLAVVIFYITSRYQLPEYIYLTLSIFLALYCLPFRLLVKREEKKWFTVLTSIVFAQMLIFSALFLFNSESREIQNTLGITGIICMTLLIYKFIFEKLDVKTFMLLFGFCLLASVYL